MPRGSKPGERRGGRQRNTPNRRTVLADRILAAVSGHPTASWRQLVIILVKDRALPADVRMAMARDLPAHTSRSANTRSRRSSVRKRQQTELASPASSAPSPATGLLQGDTTGALQSSGVAQSFGAVRSSAGTPTDTDVVTADRGPLDRLDVLLSIAKDPTASPAQRRKAAVGVAQHFLPKRSGVNRPPGAFPDEYGFVIAPEIAREYRDGKLQLWHLSVGPGSNVLATER